MKRLTVLAGFVAVAAFAAVLAPVRGALAHPLGNFTINHFARIEVYSDEIRVHWVLDMAEVPTFQEMSTLDQDADGVVSDAERAAYLAGVLPGLLSRLSLQRGDGALSFEVLSSDLTLVDAQAGLQTLRLTLDLQASGGDAESVIRFADSTYPDRIGWREMVVVGGEGVPLGGVTVPAVSVSNELRAYPDDLLSSPLDVRSTAFTYRGGVGEVAPPFRSENGVVSDGKKGGALEDLLSTDDLTPPVIALAMLVAFGLGAIHALSPGHGKTIVAAYFVGTGGTPRQALFLALTVTLAHTAGVLALGAVTLWASEYVVPEDLYPTLTLASGVVLIGFGTVMLLRWLRDRRPMTVHAHSIAHEHPHDHSETNDHAHVHGDAHDHGVLSPLDHARAHLAGRTAAEGLPWRSLLTLGISGGILPSPTALIVLLGAISLHRLGFGLVLIFMFSLGLATVLTGVGLAFVIARRLLSRVRAAPKLAAYAPAAGAAGIAAAGVLLAARGFMAL